MLNDEFEVAMLGIIRSSPAPINSKLLLFIQTVTIAAADEPS